MLPVFLAGSDRSSWEVPIHQLNMPIGLLNSLNWIEQQRGPKGEG
ncbi:hypothetical protein [Novosphingobium cyanobacteriorum]|uniref:Uncharacterized protein n=1 Tax=Novosphingobium cyanobacteriorum TaxID=3024215 RepID=A0ABT6CNL8_9SPHN|nr:hypothetical protein [Novosphingobium cyanobacteriorum]MDF8334695.1 hypothetical protein [Novosphingobium cyanobacteriorum]